MRARMRMPLSTLALAVLALLAPCRALAQAPPPASAPPPSVSPPGPATPTADPAILPTGLASMLGAAPDAASGQPLRFEHAIRLALDNNERAKKTPLRVEQSAGARDRARGAFYPTVTATGSSVTHAQADRTGRSTTTTTTATLTQPIVNASAFPLYSQASHQLESDRWGALQDRRSLAFDTAKAFLTALTDQRLVEAAQHRLDQSRTNLADAEARAAAGLASTNDATKARLAVSTAQSSLIQAHGRLASAYINLGFLCAQPVAPPFEEPTATIDQAQNWERDPTNQLKAALDRRPDLKSIHEKVAAQRAAAAEPLYRLVPTLTGALAIRALPFPARTDTATDETATLNLSWVIWDAGFRYADRKTRLAQAESSAYDESLLRRQIDTDVRTALVALRIARASYKVAQEGAATAKQNTEETQILYKQGLVKGLELTDATAKEFDADVTLAEAKLSLEQAYIDLRFALGLAPTDDPEVAAADGGAVK